MVNGGRSYNPAVITAPVLTPLKLDDRRHALFGRQDGAGRAEFLGELDDTVNLLRNAPSVVAWVPFNEGWGQFDSVAVTERLRTLDPTRVVDSVSGWHDQGAGHMASRHVYFVPYTLSEADEADPRAAVLASTAATATASPGTRGPTRSSATGGSATAVPSSGRSCGCRPARSGPRSRAGWQGSCTPRSPTSSRRPTDS